MSRTMATPMPRNGVDVPTLFATLNAVKGQPEIAKFQFRATNKWMSGTHSTTTINGYYGAMQEQKRAADFTFGGDHPAVLVGTDKAPTPVEFLLHALAACLTAGIGNIASARGINLEMVESTVEGNIDLMGLLGLDDKVRNGYQGIRVSFRIKGNASEEELKQIVFRSKDRSAVYDVLTSGVPVDLQVEAKSA
ncbi:MAG: OsmC family protein [Thermoanaerobaculia bacterium]|nr:OsmC family protein [Thermoanaerobaculia bacterium]